MQKVAFIVGLLGIPLISSAQTRQDSWASLNSLRAGEKIEVIETNLTKHRGAFSTVSDEILQMREGGADVGIKKENVMRVTVLDKNHRLRNALIVGAVGAGAGAGIGAAASRCSTQSSFNFCGLGRGAEVGVGAVVGLLGGMGVGATIPSHPAIYRIEHH